MAIPKLLRFHDLKEANYVKNRVDLGRKIKDEEFPSGRLLGPNTRAWTEDEIQAWLDSRPVNRAPDAIPREQRFGSSAQAAAAAQAKADTTKRQRPGRTLPKRKRRTRR